MRPRCILLAIPVLVVAAFGLTASTGPSRYRFPTRAVAETAEAFRDGFAGGQCKVFVGNVVAALTGIYPGGYQQGFARSGAVEILDPANAVRGDIVQITPRGSRDDTAESLYRLDDPTMRLHTMILRSARDPSGAFDVIDSNLGHDGLVHRHRMDPYQWARGSIIRIWRYGVAFG